MPKIKISPEQFFDNYVHGFAATVGLTAAPPFGPSPYEVFRLSAETLLGSGYATPIEFDIPNPFPAPSGSGGSPGGTPALPGMGLQPIDPIAVLNDLAEAVRGAETILNKDNLAMARAQLDVSILVNVGGVAGAEAKLSLTIGPTPNS